MTNNEFDISNLELSEKEMDALVLARYYYKYSTSGKEFMSDAMYQKLMDKLEKINPNHTLVVTTWSEDPIPYRILKKYGANPIEIQDTSDLLPNYVKEIRKNYKDSISIYASDLLNRSVKLARDMYEISRYFQNTTSATYHCSVKADGINYSATYVKSELVDVSTRSRDGDGLDITWQGRLLLPKKIDTKQEILKVSGEIVLPFKELPYFRKKYDKPYKTARNSVNSILLTCRDEDDIKRLIALSFKVKSDELNSLEEEFKWLEANKFTTPPWTVFTYSNIQTFNHVFNLMQPFKNRLSYGSDGLVLAVNNNQEFYNLGSSDKYFNGNVACKIGVWDAYTYKSTVLGIEWTYNTSKITPVLIIEPVETDEGQTVSRVNAHHVKRLLDLGIVIGSEISFNYVSSCYVELVY